MWYTKDRCPVREQFDTDEEYKEALERYDDYCQDKEDWLREQRWMQSTS